MKKNFAIITCVKNESHFLPLWMNYYSRFINVEDIYVIDNDSNDGSTDNLKCNKIPLHLEYSLDYDSIVNRVNSLHEELIEMYEYVIYTDVDEFIIPKDGRTLGNFLDSIKGSDKRFFTTNGYNVYHNIDDEDPIDLNKPILLQRKYMLKNQGYDKTLISKVPMGWSPGFHECRYDNVYFEDEDGNPHRINETGKPNHEDGLYLLHLHYFDLDLHNKKKKGYQNLSINPFQSHFAPHNKIFLEEELVNHFKSTLSESSGLIEIPEIIKESF